MTLETKQRLFLGLAAAGLTPIALSYGLRPDLTLPWLFGVDAAGINTRHIFRAVMGLYLALAVFWCFGALRPNLRLPALWSLVIFMLGLALGRALSLAVDGMPHPLLTIYMLLEVGFAAIGALLIRQSGALSGAAPANPSPPR